MVKIAVQFLEDSPALAQIAPQAVRSHLREAFERLPVDDLLLCWNVPQPLFEAVVEETQQAEVRLFRWHPLLCGDGTFLPRPAWQTISLAGRPVAGFRGMPEFTFVCPNQPAVRAAVEAHLQEVLCPPYQGVFFDRIRFPSPAGNLFEQLACFCPDCCTAAQEWMGFDLAGFQAALRGYLAHPAALQLVIASLFGNFSPGLPGPVAQGLQLFVRFRMESISRFTRWAGEMAAAQGMAVGLDCFSPVLTPWVGQDLAALASGSDWIKVMTYAHVLGPAGLPYELLEMSAFLERQAGMQEEETLAFLERQVGFPLPASRQALRRRGLSPAALVAEIQRARALGARPLFAGLELVEIPGVCELSEGQIRQDWQAVKEQGVEGVVLSWDLWHIPLERLAWVREILEI